MLLVDVETKVVENTFAEASDTSYRAGNRPIALPICDSACHMRQATHTPRCISGVYCCRDVGAPLQQAEGEEALVGVRTRLGLRWTLCI